MACLGVNRMDLKKDGSASDQETRGRCPTKGLLSSPVSLYYLAVITK